MSLQIFGLYIFAGAITIISLIYSFVFNSIKNKYLFSIIQIIIDTFLVTGLIYFTGSYNSFFQFLYLVVILYSSSVLLGGKPFWVASLVSIQYGLLVDLQYFGILKIFFVFNHGRDVSGFGLFFQVLVFVVSSFAVAWLASLLSVQVKNAKQDLIEMDSYVKRVEKLAHAGEIAAGFAHEIKNPMASLRGAIQLLVSDVKNNRKDDLERLGNIVLRESDRLDNLINDFLYFAKPAYCNKKNINPANEIRDIIKIFEQDHRVKGAININTTLDESLTLYMDQGHFRQIMWNLFINAAEAQSDFAEKLIDVVVFKYESNVKIVVRDFGNGINPQYLDKIFDPFFSTKKKGSGLGLSIVARLVELYSGVIKIKNAKSGKGVEAVVCFESNSY